MYAKNIYHMLLHAMFLTLLTAGCKTTETGSQPASEVPVEDPCDAINRTCTVEYEPTHCRLFKTDAYLLPPEMELHSWGSNACVASVAMERQICKKNFPRDLLSLAVCAPTNSFAACNTQAEPCDNANAPTVCILGSYGNSLLKDPHRLAGWGANKCHAEQALHQTICRADLDPQKATDIQCIGDQAFPECPPTPKEPCPSEQKSVICKVNLLTPNGEKNLSLFAPNACMGTASLKRIACLNLVPPGKVDSQIVCHEASQ